MADTSRAWIVGAILMVLLVVTIRLLRRRWGIGMGWALQGVVLVTSLVVGWSMLIVGVIFAVLWFFAVRLGTRVDRLKQAQQPG